LSGGTATLTLNAQLAGTNSITAYYSGDAVYSGATSTAVTTTVPQATPTLTLAASSSTSPAGSPVTFTAAVASGGPVPTGAVSFYAGGVQIGGLVPLSGGSATVAATTLAAGTNSITAQYTGDTNYAGAVSNSVPVTIVKLTPSVVLSSSAAASTVSSALTFTAAVTGSATKPTGSVTFYSGSTPLSAAIPLKLGVARLTTSSLAVGADAISVQYSGDALYTAATSNPLSETIAKQTPAATLTSSAATGILGNSITFTATISGTVGTPTGSVTFYSGSIALGKSVPLNNGTASLTTASLAAGTDVVTAQYSGNALYSAAVSNSFSASIARLTPTAVLTASTNVTAVTKAIVFKVAVNGSGPVPTGTVTFYSGTTALSAAIPLSKGAASYTSSSLPAGVEKITARYTGDTDYVSSTSNIVNEIITRLPSVVTLKSSTTTAAAGTKITLTATIAGKGNVPTGSVSFTAGSTLLGKVALQNGTATLSTSKLASGSYTLSANYSGDSMYMAQSSNTIKQVINKKGNHK
jgi:hypothetical protein